MKSTNIICPHCQQEHPDTARFCPVTGQTLLPPTQERCSTCGGGVPSGQKFCPHCGSPVQPVRKGLPTWLFPLLIALGLVIIAAGGYLTFRILFPQQETPVPASQTEAGALPQEPEPDAATATATDAIMAQLDTPTELAPPPSNTPQATATPVPALPTNTLVPTNTTVPTFTPVPSQTPINQPIALEINQKDGAEIVLVPAGEFTMGSDPDTDPYIWGAESPQHAVNLDEFWIYRTEVTNAMYQACVEAKACPRPDYTTGVTTEDYYGNPAYASYPVIFVTYTHALSYCKWAGGKLPTEAQWEKAARGSDGRLFPWGNETPTSERANLCDSQCAGGTERVASINDGYPGPAPVGSFPQGASPYGALDMAGNVWEWVFDWFHLAYYGSSPYENPLGPASGTTRVFRGGGWNNEISGIRTVVRSSLTPSKSLNGLGFRCVVESP